MALYKPAPHVKNYWYDFQIAGQRFRADSETSNKRQAMAKEATARAEAKAAIAAAAETARQFRGGEIGFGAARQRYMAEHGQFLAKAGEIDKALGWVEARLPCLGETLLSQIDNAEISRLVALKRAEPSKAGHNRKEGTKAKHAAPLRLSLSTVNRDMTEPLRQLLRKARRKWSCATIDIDWSEHRFKEKNERVREASIAEESAVMAVLDRGYDVAVDFAFKSGCRLAEIVSLTWDKVNFFAGELYVTGKGDKTRTIPMTAGIRKLLEAQRGLDAAYVFTYVAKRTRAAEQLVRGERYPLTYSGLQSRMRRAVPAAGVSDFHMHDTRHTKATRTLRASGNLKLVKDLLGHASIKTTERYAHVLTEDIRIAMEASEAAEMQARANIPQQIPQQSPATARKALKLVRKSA